MGTDDKLAIITRAFDQLESDLKSAYERGEMDERHYDVSRVMLEAQRFEKLCDEVPGFREEFNRTLSTPTGAAWNERFLRKILKPDEN